jgi:hypothetical protein
VGCKMEDLILDYSVYFFEKKDMMLPWPGLLPPPPPAAPFFPVGLEVTVEESLAFLGAGSSSEKDSQTASSRVTVVVFVSSAPWTQNG